MIKFTNCHSTDKSLANSRKFTPACLHIAGDGVSSCASFCGLVPVVPVVPVVYSFPRGSRLYGLDMTHLPGYVLACVFQIRFGVAIHISKCSG